MLVNDFKGLILPRLGFGAMRLPLLSEESGEIDRKQVNEMVDYAMKCGVNYFDTAYPYHGGVSEIVMGESLSRYPRESYYLATKYPGHQLSSTYDPEAVFEEQLKKCGVEYFDFYLLHNVYENSIQVYTDAKWGILEYFAEQKCRGRIRHLGFSSHGSIQILEEFLEYAGEHMEFCQIQLNYLDWTLQKAKEKYEMLTDRGIGVWVMEPIRGGRLARLSQEEEACLRKMRPEESSAAWALRFVQDLPNVKMVLSGMSEMQQMVENAKTFSKEKPLTYGEREKLLELAEGMKNSVPCTACRYCCGDCPMQLDIPMLLSVYNELRFHSAVITAIRLDGLSEEERSSACIACGKCTKICPQNIDIPAAMRGLTEELKKLPSWEEVCRQREEEAKKLR